MANEAKQFTIGGVTHDVMDVGARQLITQLQAAIDAITGGDTTTAIKTFQEVIDFLDGVTDDATLIGKLNELRTLINAKYSKPASGIPASDLAPSVQTSLGLADTALQPADKTQLQNAINSLQSALDALIGSGNVQGAIDTFNEVKAFLDGIDTDDPTLFNQLKSLSDAITALQTTLSQKANDNAVVKSISVNGTPQSKDSSGNVNIQVQTGGQVSVIQPDPADGTFIIRVGSTDYTINLNHTHENMAKLIVCEESDLPSTLDMDTIYAQVNDAETPTEIQSLWIAGLEFVGGGGAIDDSPRLITPRDGLTLDFDGQSTLQLSVRGKNLLADLSLSVSGDFTVTDGNGTTVSTITATAANDGVALLLTKGSNYDSGTLRIFSSEVDVTVTLKRDITLPDGYSPLEAVSVNSMILSLANTNISVYSSWRVVASSRGSNVAQILICQGRTAVGRYFGITKDSKWGVATTVTIDGLSITDKTEALVEFSNSSTRLTIGENTITASPQQTAGSFLELFGCSYGEHYYFNGDVYEIECVSGGSFLAYPAKRLSDNEVGLYDVRNDVFYTGFLYN